MHRKHPILSSSGLFWRGVTSSGMFVCILLAPIALGAAMRFGLPLVYQRWPQTGILKDYTPLMDGLLLLLTPYLTLFASALVTLEERDNGICLALTVTPLGPRGYLVSRFLLPGALAAVYTMVVGLIFSQVGRPLWHTALLAIPAAFVALWALAPIPARARDKISGMAMGKVCSLWILSVALPFFLPWKWQPALCWLPSYWFYRFLIWPDWLMAVLCVACALLWCALFYRSFRRRLARG